MLVVKSPLRVSLFGGGCDLPEYYSEHGALIVSFALDRCIHLIYNHRPTGGYRVSYSKIEELENLRMAEHTLVRAAASLPHPRGPLPPCTISIVSDVPKGTGLGSSSALAVALMCLMRNNANASPQAQLEVAFNLERRLSPVGIQDFLPPIFGGFNVYRIDRKGHVEAERAPMHLRRLVEMYGLLLYTGIDRDAAPILRKVRRSEKELRGIHTIAGAAAKKLNYFNHITLGEALTETWKRKREISGVTSARLDNQFTAALEAGVTGGKLCGAGGGGCWFFIVPPIDRPGVIEALGLPEIPFKIGPALQEYDL